MSEGGLAAPVRHAVAWRDVDFYDSEALDAELRRVFDVCHGCRRCFNLCDSFPRLFNLIDDSERGELDSVASDGFKTVADACTLCDMCFMAKCPYVPPHEFNIDFPHLMLRYRAVEARKKGIGFIRRQLTETDRNGRLAGRVASLANWTSQCGNSLTRPLLEHVAGVHRDAALPRYHSRTFVDRVELEPVEIDWGAPAAGRKVVLFATCFVNYNNFEIGLASRAVLARNGVEPKVVYPGCCGMPQLELSDVARVAEHAARIAAALRPMIEDGYDVVVLMPSCALMLKFEWPLILPESDDVKRLSEATRDISEYIVDIAENEGLARGLKPLEGGVVLHLACHARAQNIGAKATEMLALLPETDVHVIERCSGHGGSWGFMKANFEVALKVGRPVALEATGKNPRYLISECPLAREHIVQGMERLDYVVESLVTVSHPVQLMARAYELS